MEFWDNLSAATKGVIVGGALLLVVLLIVRALEPEDGPELKPGIPPGMARSQ
jgi:hypothetical protein